MDEIGEGVAVGDEALAWTVTGAYAEYALATEFTTKPADLDWDTAAALPVAVETSVRVLDELKISEGDTLLLHGAAGAVGAVGVQLAVARGAAPQGDDAVFDAAGQGDLPVLIELRGGTDRIVTIADPQAAELGVTFSGGGGPFGAKLAEYARLAAEGKLAVRVAKSLPLAEAAKAQQLSATGHAGGKVVLHPSS